MPFRFCLLFIASWILTAAASGQNAVPQPLTAFLDRHCVECHDSEVKKGGLDLQSQDFNLMLADRRQEWARVFDRVHAGEMPPKKSERPEASALKDFLARLEVGLIKADDADASANGRVRSRRLTRVEYEHTLHDLLGIDIPLKDLLPEDPESHGFATVAEGQQLSQHQLARYLDVADQALNEAFKRVLHGEATFQKSHSPQDLLKADRGNYRGVDMRNGRSLSWPFTLQFTGRMPATSVPESGWYRITLRQVKAVNPGANGSVWGTLRSGACVSSTPMLYMAGLVEATPEPRDLVYETWIQKGHMLEIKPNDATLKRAPTGAKGGNVSFQGRDLEKEGFSGISNRGIEMERIYPFADRATVRRNLLGDTAKKNWATDPVPLLEKLVARFARRAFRRPATEDQLSLYLAAGRDALAAGDTLPQALLVCYRTILCSPRFLTLFEKPGALDDHALAARLSYTFWVSQPDKVLTALADAGKLSQPTVLAEQVTRMLADPKADRFIRSFTDQWLKLAKIDFTSPDNRLYPTFDPVVQESMVQETRAYVTEMLKNDLSITHLIDSNFVFLNGRLARHYQIKEPIKPGGGMQKVGLTNLKEGTRGGILTQGAILKITADGTSTSPVIRGVFVNERLLGLHIAPPPPGIPAIEPDIRGATSIRDQLEKHRSNTSCNSCHAVIDPPGFVLENFDPIGIWRNKYGSKGKGVAVNPAGVTSQGEMFANLREWKDLHVLRSRELAYGFASHFITYATGSSVRFGDRREIQDIVAQAEGKNFGMRSLIEAAIQSPMFLNK